MKDLYREETRLAQRWFTLTKGGLLEVRGRDRGRKFDRDFKFSELSTSTKNVVSLRPDIMWRCLRYAVISAFLGLIISSMRFPFASVALWLGLIVAAKLVWSAFGWARKKVEVEIFHSRKGDEAFVMFNDKPGDADFAAFVQQLKSRIGGAEEQEANQSAQTRSLARPV